MTSIAPPGPARKGHLPTQGMHTPTTEEQSLSVALKPQPPPPHLPHLPGREVYDLLEPGYRGRCTAPLLIDTKARRIVCNESSLIVRGLGRLALEGGTGVDLYPQALAAEIDAWNDK